MVRLKSLLFESDLSEEVTSGSEPINGKSKTNAKNWVHGKVDKYTKGFFSDEYWKPIQTIFKEFDAQGLNWVPTGAKYEEEVKTLADGSRHSVPVRKTWTFEISFVNNRDKGDVLYGRIVAAGSGPIENPLDRYDVTLTLS